MQKMTNHSHCHNHTSVCWCCYWWWRRRWWWWWWWWLQWAVMFNSTVSLLRTHLTHLSLTGTQRSLSMVSTPWKWTMSGQVTSQVSSHTIIHLLQVFPAHLATSSDQVSSHTIIHLLQVFPAHLATCNDQVSSHTINHLLQIFPAYLATSSEQVSSRTLWIHSAASPVTTVILIRWAMLTWQASSPITCRVYHKVVNDVTLWLNVLLRVV